jgi:hypothetical protein
MFHERLASVAETLPDMTAEAVIRAKMRWLINAINGLFGKVMAELIAEGQSDPAVLQELYARHISPRRASSVADIERGKNAGEFLPDVDAVLLVDTIFGPVYYRFLLGLKPLTQQYGDLLIDQALRGWRSHDSNKV